MSDSDEVAASSAPDRPPLQLSGQSDPLPLPCSSSKSKCTHDVLLHTPQGPSVEETVVSNDEATNRNGESSSRHVAASFDFLQAGRGNGSTAAAFNAYHYPGPMGIYQQPFYHHPFHPSMYATQPMSGMAGVGFVPFSQAQNHFHAPPSSSAYHQSGTSGNNGPTSNACPAPGTSGSGAARRKKDVGVRRSSPRSGSESPQRDERRSSRTPVSYRGERDSSRRKRSASPRSRECLSSRAGRSRRRQKRSSSRGSSYSPRRRGQISPPSSSSPSSRREFVQKARFQHSPSASPFHSANSGSEASVSDEEDHALSRSECLALIRDLKPDLVTSGDSNKKVLSAGERAFSRRKSQDSALRFVQSSLVSDTLAKIQTEIRKESELLPDQPVDLPHATLKTGELVKPPHVFTSSFSRKISSPLAEGNLPSEKLTPSSSDLTSRSKSSGNFKPVLKEKGLLSLEESALRGLQSLSVVDSILGIVADCVNDNRPLDQSYARRPSSRELSQLINFACKGINHAVDASARCYLNTVLIKRDCFLKSADRLPDENDRSALRSLPISAPALIGPQVAANVERWEKRQFDSSVRSIMSRADKRKHSPQKRHLSASSHTPASKFRKFDSSYSRSSSHGGASRGRFPSKRGKSKPKASAHPQ